MDTRDKIIAITEIESVAGYDENRLKDERDPNLRILVAESEQDIRKSGASLIRWAESHEIMLANSSLRTFEAASLKGTMRSMPWSASSGCSRCASASVRPANRTTGKYGTLKAGFSAASSNDCPAIHAKQVSLGQTGWRGILLVTDSPGSDRE
jgi:hypothetical protein